MKDAGIVLVINGYYRSGTTFLAKLFVRANPDMVYIHEPCSPIIGDELRKHQVGTPHPLHGWDIYEGYFKLGQDFVRKFIESYRPFSFIREPEKVVEILGVIDDEARKRGKRVIVKLNQGHLVLERIVRELKCKVIHVMNRPLKVMYEHIYPEYKERLLLIIDYWLGKTKRGAEFVGFWFESLADEVIDFFNLYQYKNVCPAFKFLISYLLLNRIAVRQAEYFSEILLIDYPTLMAALYDGDTEVAQYLEKFTEMEISEDVIAEIDLDAALYIPDIVRTIFTPYLARAQSITGFSYE